MADKITVIPSVRQVYYDAYTSLPTSGLTVGDFGYATDRLTLYRWSGSAWQEITIHSSSGLYSAIPTAADLPEGSLFYSTDRKVVYQVQSGSWIAVSIFSGSGLLADIPTAGDLPEGSIYHATDTGTLYQNQSGSWVALVSLFAATNPESLTPSSSTAQGTGTTAARVDHVHGMSGFSQIASGSYTGNGVDGRNITVGFIPDLVLITYVGLGNGYSWIIIGDMIGISHTISSPYHDDESQMYIDTSDGFIIGDDQYTANNDTRTYNYIAIKGG